MSNYLHDYYYRFCDEMVNKTDYWSICSDMVQLVHMQEEKNEQKRFSKPLPWIGIYIAVASLLCTLAMAADSFHGFRQRKLWFPCKFFTLNAASLTVLAVALKLAVDLNNPMPGVADQLSKLSSLVFLCTMMCNFMPSLGSMDDKELLTNITALAILVITIVVNVCIEISTTVIDDYSPFVGHVVPFLLILLVIMSSLALTVSISKNVIELKYRKMHKIIASDIYSKNSGKSTVEKLKDDVIKYWIMTETGTGSPQFMIACCATCSASGAICLFFAALFVIDLAFLFPYGTVKGYNSDYEWSTPLILIIQSIGVVVGSIALAFRWFTALSFKLTMKWSKNCLNVFKVESYWTQRLVEWKQISPSAISIGGRKCRKFVHNVKNCILTLCIWFFVVIVIASKVIRLVPIFIVILFLYCYYGCKLLKRKFINKPSPPSTPTGEKALPSKSEDSGELSHYVLQLDDEVELSRRTLKSITGTVNRLVHTATKQQPKNLMELLEKSKGFKGVAEFDSDQVTHLHSEDPPNCWSLPVITLTSIAVALPSIKKDVADRLLSSVKQGLSYVRQVEKNLDVKGDLVNIIKAAEIVWPEVQLNRKWLDNNLEKKALKAKTSKDILLWLGEKAKDIVSVKRTANGDLEENPVDWPVEVIAANSMYRISQTILLDYQGSEYETNEKLFEKLSMMIADILCACLTNLPRVITMKCYCSAIEKREESVRIAARLLGETEEIIKILQEQELPGLDPEQAAFIDEWRLSVKHQNPADSVSSSNNGEASSCPIQLQKNNSI